jgi:cardiolipin synthase A/B
MFRRNARASAAALVCVAAVTLAVAGCKIDPPAAAAAGPAAGPGPDPEVTRAGALIIEPGAGFSPVYGLISGARHSIDVTMYEFDDTTAEHDLAAAAKRGVRVRVILDEREKNINSNAFSYFSSHRVKVVWSWSRFTYTHQKTLVIDESKAVIMTANLTSEYYRTSRDFLVIDTNRVDVADLVWSPTDSQDKLLALINGATSSLRVYSEEMGDTTVEDALIRAAKRGVDVQICGENEDGEYASAYARLARAGIHIAYYSSPTGFYIHGKVIEADYGTGHARMFVGSENFSRTSLDDNRELGLIISDPAVLSAMAATFAADFRNGRHWP